MTNPKKIDYIENNHESRITRLEVTIENINQNLSQINNKLDKLDNRIWQMMLFTVGGFAALLAVMARGFHWL